MPEVGSSVSAATREEPEAKQRTPNPNRVQGRGRLRNKMRLHCHNPCPFYMSIYQGQVFFGCRRQTALYPGSLGLSEARRPQASKALLQKNGIC